MPPIHKGELAVAVKKMARARPAAAVSEIAARLGCHPDTVRRHLRGTPRHAPEPLRHRRAVPSSELEGSGYTPDEVKVAARFAENPESERWVFDVIRFSHNNSTGLLLCEVLLARPDCPAEAIAAIADSRDMESLRDQAAAHPNCPPEVQQRLAQRPRSMRVRVAAASNPNSVGETLGELCDSDNTDLRSEAARYRRASARILKRLVTDPDPLVRAAVGGNRRSPQRLVNRCAVDPSHEVRVAAAGNPQVAVRLLPRLAADNEPSVRAQAARNPNCPQGILRTLSTDPDPLVREAAQADALRRLRRGSRS